MSIVRPVLAAALLLVTTACAAQRGSPGALSDIQPGRRPSPDTEEAGLWMQTDRLEADLKTSGALVTDPALNAYVRDIVCRLADAYCADIRIYILRVPHFNASMMPNGVMQVWTGLILRVENEAQLAYVLGHELGHYLRRHSLQRWRDVRAKSAFLEFFGVLTAPTGFSPLASLGAQLAVLGSIFAFSRDNEREADELGFGLAVKAGYDPREASKVWEALVKERDATKGSTPFIFFATHPAPEERIENLKAFAKKGAQDGGHAVIGRDQFLARILPLRTMLLRDELRRREFAGSQVVLDRLFEAGVGLGELYFFQGELYRLRDKRGDREKTITAYQKALEYGDAPVEGHRALGLVFFKGGEKEKARLAFERYLQQRPNAEDREMIEAYLRQLE